MFENLFDQTNLLTFFFTVIRTGGVLFTVPVFSSRAIKPQLRMACSIIIALIIYPFISPVPYDVTSSLTALIISIFKELLLGVSIGALTSTLFAGVQLGGYFLDFQMGFSMVNIMDPDTGGQFSYMSQVQYVLLILIFIAIGGPGLLIRCIVYSFELLPVGDFHINSNAFLYGVNLFSKVFIIAITITAPALIVLMASNIIMGVLGKLIPQINLMVVGFPFKIALGIIIFLFSLPFFFMAFEKIAYNYFMYIQKFLRLI